MNLYEVTYHGLWLGGKAIVAAKGSWMAEDLVRFHHQTRDFKDVQVKDLGPMPVHGQVLYNDNGDY